VDFRIWALLSAFFAAVTAILAKKGVEGVPSNLALTARIFFVLAFALGIAIVTKQADFGRLTGRNWLFLGLSGIATGASWLCYFRALQAGPVSQVAPIDKLSFVLAVAMGALFLKEKMTWQTAAGAAVIVAGVLITLRSPA